MSLPKIDIHTPLPNQPKITLEFLGASGEVKGTFQNFPREMRLGAINILANGACVIIVEPVPSPIIKPIMSS